MSGEKVVSLDAHRPAPHLCGAAKCLKCGHEWQAVAPVGTRLFVCPKCECDGTLKALVIRSDELWECNCGSDLFRFDPQGAFCAECGLEPKFP